MFTYVNARARAPHLQPRILMSPLSHYGKLNKHKRYMSKRQITIRARFVRKSSRGTTSHAIQLRVRFRWISSREENSDSSRLCKITSARGRDLTHTFSVLFNVNTALCRLCGLLGFPQVKLAGGLASA